MPTTATTKVTEGENYRLIAETAARIVVELWEAKLRTVAVKHRGMKAIVAAVAITARIPAPSRETVRQWELKKGFPIRRDGVGPFVSQWALEMWLSEVYDQHRPAKQKKRAA